MEPEGMVIAWQQLGKHVPLAKNAHKIRRTVGHSVFYAVHAEVV
jgi:hypothetical protein